MHITHVYAVIEMHKIKAIACIQYKMAVRHSVERIPLPPSVVTSKQVFDNSDSNSTITLTV